MDRRCSAPAPPNAGVDESERPGSHAPWSRNVLASGYRYPFVYCAFPSGFLFRDATGSTIYDTSADRLIFQQDARSSAHYGPDAPSSILGRLRLEHGKTILQTSYDRLWNNMHR